MIDGEPRPQRPGTTGPHDVGPGPRGADPHEYASDEDVVDEGGPQGLAVIVRDTIAAVEFLWGEVDPRAGASARLGRHHPDATDSLAAFFATATTFLSVLESIYADLSAVTQADTEFKANLVGEARGKLIARVIEILGKAGVEVDEADVDSWDESQRGDAVEWATYERKANTGDGSNPYPKPIFLPGDME